MDSWAARGDRNVFVRCDVRAKPQVVRLHWIIDDNGTTVREGEVVNEYWTLVMVRDQHTHRLVTFRVSRRRRKMYCGHARLCVCLSVCPRPYAHTTARTRM